MSKNFQHEVPPARINITLDVETHGVQQNKELPCKLLCLADLSNGHPTKSLPRQARISINKDNFNAVLAAYQPQLSFHVENLIDKSNPRLPINLTCQSIDDFLPEQVVQQVPQLKQLLAMRHLLKDLKANLLDKRQAWQILQNTLNDTVKLAALKKEITQRTTA